MQVDALSRPALNPLRRELLAELAVVSAAPDAAELLGVPAGAAEELLANVAWQSMPALRAGELYSGVLFDALDLPTLDAAARRRANRDVLIFSALHGVLGFTDRAAPYRLSAGASLPTAGSVTARWRAELAPVLDAESAGQLIVDARSTGYRAMWRPVERELWVTVDVPGASHHAKHTRGLITRQLLEHGGRLRHPGDLLAPLRPFDPWLEQQAGGGHRLLVSPPG